MKQINYTIDTIKFFCAIAVIFIHITAFIYHDGMAEVLNYYSYRYLLDIAVPFFLITSGLFIAKKSTYELIKYIKNIFKIFIIFSLFYISIDIIIIFIERIAFKSLFWSNVITVFDRLTFSNFIKGTSGQFHLWYLMALVIAVLILFFMKKLKLTNNWILFISIGIYIIANTGLIDLTSIVLWGGFPKALLYVSLGYFIADLNLSIIKWPFLKFILFASLFSIYSILSRSGLSQFLLVLTVSFLLIFAIKHPGKPNILAKWGRKYSLSIYIMHVFIYTSFYRIIGYLEITDFKDATLNVFLLGFLCIIGSILVYIPIEKYFYKPLSRRIDTYLNPPKNAFEVMFSEKIS